MRIKNQKAIWIVIIILALFIAGINYYSKLIRPKSSAPNNQEQVKTDTSQTSQQAGVNSSSRDVVKADNSQTNPPNGQANATGSKPVFSAGEDQADLGADILVAEVSFNGTSFTPASVEIKVGDYVVFKNNSTVDFWPASNPHPVHTDYPEFDAKQNIAPGNKWQFQFLKAGTWKYHDHLDPSIQGVIVVSAK